MRKTRQRYHQQETHIPRFPQLIFRERSDKRVPVPLPSTDTSGGDDWVCRGISYAQTVLSMQD